jgi:excisionase family DNA binding protein
LPRNRAGSKGRASDVLSTKEAASICKVALSTIVYWFDKGLIRGYRTPGGHRRIFRMDLESFMRDHAIPLGDRLNDQLRVLVVGRDPAVMGLLDETLHSMNGHVDWTSAAGAFQAGRLVATFGPNLMFVDSDVPELDGADLCRQLKDDPNTRDIDVVLISNSAGRADAKALREAREAGAAEVLTKPVTRKQLRLIVSSFLS